MGITVILGVNGVVGSIKGENFIEEYYDYNFEYIDTQFTQYERDTKELPQFDEHFIEQIENIDGVESVTIGKTIWAAIDFDEAALEEFMRMKYEDSSYMTKDVSYEQMVAELREYANAGEYGCYVTTLVDYNALEEYNQNHDTPIDIEAFRRGEFAIVGMDNEQFAPNARLVGKTLTLTADSADGKPIDFPIGGAFTFDDYSNTLSDNIDRRKDIEIVPNVIFVSEAGMERLTQEAIISGIGVDIKDMSELEQIDRELQSVNSTLTVSEWQFNSPVAELEEFDQMFYSINLLGNGAAILLIVLGLINFVNVMLTGVIARKM
ncbi:ABC transporter permease protein, partial [human gut metagenome]